MDVEAGIAALALNVYWFSVDNIQYRVIDDGNYDKVKVDLALPSLSGEVEIPATVTYTDTGSGSSSSFQVVEIGEGAFDGRNKITKITIPDSVTSIRRGAFSDCSALAEVTIPSSVTSIESRVFSGCSALAEVTIPNGVTSIGNSAFSGCSALAEVTIPSGVTSIGDSAFSGCTGLTNITIPNSVTSIGTYALYCCSGLTNVMIPNSVTSIGAYALGGCKGLTEVTIPDQITSIGEQVFCSCRALRYVVLENDAVSIKSKAFEGCPHFTDLHIVVPSGENPRLPSVEADTFLDSPDYWDHITFVDTDGNKLQGKVYCDVFDDAAGRDGDSNDYEWYGWAYYHELRIAVKKDVQPWRDHQKTFVLSKDDGVTFVTDLKKVEQAATTDTYTLYEVTGLATADEFREKGVNTGVTLEVKGTSVAILNKTVDYYTATFYDRDANNQAVPYGVGTDWEPQTVLMMVGRVARPLTNPQKDGYTFEKWVQSWDETTEFDFGSSIGPHTKIYAKWRKNTEPTYKVTINVRKEGQEWKNHGKTFALLRSGGSGFLEVSGQGEGSRYRITQVPNGIYSIYDMTGVLADSLYSRARDTGMDVQVNGTDTEVDVTVDGEDEETNVDYYTATFFDGTQAYQANTPQKPQIVLKGQRVQKPADPSKAGYDFAGWKTTDGGSAAYDFATAVTGTTGIFASWVEKAPEQFHITASSTEGGTISPIGDISVTKGGELTFTITPDEGHKIKTVTVDGRDATAELKDTLARAQAGARYYTFTNVTEDHMIHAAFETDGGEPGVDDKPGRGKKPDDGDTPDGGENPVPGDGGGAEEIQNVAVIQLSAPQVAEKKASNGSEPKTGDATQVEVYATVAMIAGLTYLLLYFMEEGRGMTEREKEVFVAAFIRWAKKGGRFRKCCAIAAIFCLLVYYHGIGKRAGKNRFDRECLRQAM